MPERLGQKSTENVEEIFSNLMRVDQLSIGYILIAYPPHLVIEIEGLKVSIWQKIYN